jgi:hypothetical protein
MEIAVVTFAAASFAVNAVAGAFGYRWARGVLGELHALRITAAEQAGEIRGLRAAIAALSGRGAR